MIVSYWTLVGSPLGGVGIPPWAPCRPPPRRAAGPCSWRVLLRAGDGEVRTPREDRPTRAGVRIRGPPIAITSRPDAALPVAPEARRPSLGERQVSSGASERNHPAAPNSTGAPGPR